MKSKLFIGLAFAALATGGCFLAGNSTPRHQFTPDEIANIEALTAGESSTTGVQVQCQTLYSSLCSAWCYRCGATYFRSSGAPGKCVGIIGTCKCGNRSLKAL